MISPLPLAPLPLAVLRARIRRLERAGRPGIPSPESGALSFGIKAIDAHLPEGGLALGALHEIIGHEVGNIGADGAASLFSAALLARLTGPVLWCHGGQGLFPDLFPPGLAGVGLAPDRVIHVEAGEQKTVLLAMEEGLRQRGLACVVGEVFRLPMLASRRLALAAEGSGALALVLPRGQGEERAPTAAATRWRVRPLPSPPGAPGSGRALWGRALWRLELLRCRGAATASWVVEAPDAAGRLDLAGVLPDGSAAPVRQGARG
jgi:protein ImuA